MFGFWIAFLTLSAYVTGRVISSSEFILLVGDCGKSLLVGSRGRVFPSSYS